MQTPNQPAKKANPLLEMAITIIIPSLILMKLSGAEYLGTVWALITALSLPLAWGIIDWMRNGKINMFAAFGLVSVVLTGGIGLLELDNRWLAIKEAAIPAIIGIIVLGSAFTRYPLIKTFLYNPAVINVEYVQQRLEQRNNRAAFDQRLRNATWFLGGTFFFSAVMNFILATWIVTSPAGTEAFNEELGQLTLLSYPVIALPSMVMMLFILYYISRAARELADMGFMEMLHNDLQQQQKS